ncbi:MAG: serine/threonine-protein kinase, partial [Planctomycetota bacterium]|nr:serine/threonine-protein kinase [Planctomycetota bacterium]
MDPTVGLSETDAVGARRAVELGWVTQADVEQAITAQRQDPSTRLIDHLPLDPHQHGMLAEASTGPIPPEAAAAMDLPENRFGRYWKIRAVGAGGMGEVWLAWDETLRRRVALKFLRRPEEGEAANNLLREARLAGGLEHPNIAKVYEVGDVDGLPYIAMQFIDGRTLGEAAKDLKLPETIAAVTRVAEAVRAAHEQRVIHRDIKPANVMIDGKGHVFVMDFGLAKERPVEGWTLGASNVIAGTPQFMAPEQTHGRADEQSDIYSIGAVLYSLTTGRPPFVGETTLDILIQVRDREPVWPRKLAPSLPADVEAIILRALEKEKARRYRNATELIEDLEAFSNGNPLRHARRPTLVYVLAKKIRKHRAAWALSGALVVAVLAAVVWVSLVRLSARNREAALKQISALSANITERKREMRSGRMDAEEALASLRSAVGAVDRYVRDWPDEPNAYYVRARGLV